MASILVLTATSHAQFLTQSADGKSSIPLPLNGLGLGVDIGKTDVTVGLNNYGKVLRSTDKKFKNNFLMGFNLSARNSDGLGNLFSSGDIVPEGNFLGFLGYSFSNNAAILRAFGASGVDEAIAKEKKEDARILRNYKRKLCNAIETLALDIDDMDLSLQVKHKLTEEVIKARNSDAIDKVLGDFGKEEKKLEDFKKDLGEQKEKFKRDYVKEFNEIRERFALIHQQAFPKFLKSIVPVRATFFLQGGINARSFKRYLGLNTSNLSNSFQDTLFRGGNIGLGMNFQVANYWLGATYSYLDGDNFDNLQSKDYTLRTTDSVGNRTLVGEKKITAYAGKYSKVQTNQLNVDVVGEYALSDTSRLLVNLYLRASLFSRDTSFLTNYTNIGAGLYFIDKKSKFLGGLYIELPDVNNNFEKAKPADEINIKSPFRKLTFGIVTKFSISSILGWTDRPRDKD